MPIFHFHTHDDVSGLSPDWEGTELPDVETARHEALRLAGVIIADRGALGERLGAWRLELTDHDSVTLLNLDFTVRAAAAASAARDSFKPAADRRLVAAL